MFRLNSPLALIVLALLPTPAWAARLPDWAESIAEARPQLPEEVTDHGSRVLLQETLLRVDDDGLLHTTRRTATQALSASAHDVGLGFFPFDDDTQHLKSRAWHLSPESGRAKRSRTEVDVQLSDSFLTDAMTRVMAVPDVERGSLVFFEFVAEESPPQLAYRELFVTDVPLDVARVSVEVPPGWQVRHAWLRSDGVEARREGDRLVWELRDLAAPRAERLAESSVQRAPLLQLVMLPPDGARTDSATFASWAEFGAWFTELAAGRAASTPAIASQVGEVAPPDDLLGQIETLGRWVRDSVRYVAKEIGIDGYRPRPASQVLENLYGDCKDKGTLLQAMLESRDREAYPVLIHATLDDTVADDLPTLLAFNHYVVAIPLGDDLETPERFRHALVDGGPLGPLLIVDATDEFTAIGDLAANLAGKRGLVIAPSGTQLIELPGADADAHGQERSYGARIDEDGSVEIEIVDRRWGDPAASSRAAWAASQQEYLDYVGDFLREEWPDATVGEVDVMPHEDEGRFRRSMSLSLAPVQGGTTAPLLQLFPGALDLLPRSSMRRRESAVVYGYARTLRVSTTVEGIPLPASAPESVDASGAGWSVRSRHELDGSTLRSELELELSRRRFDPEAFDELKDFWRAARSAAGAVVARRPD